MGLLDGKVAIVTGSGHGIGRGHAMEMARHGAKIVVNGVETRTDTDGVFLLDRAAAGSPVLVKVPGYEKKTVTATAPSSNSQPTPSATRPLETKSRLATSLAV